MDPAPRPRPRRLIYQVAVGERPAFYGPCMASVRAYAERIGADYHAQGEPILRIVPKRSQRSENALRLGYLPIYEKQAALACLETHDQVAIIDADIHVLPWAPDIFEAAWPGEFAGVLERDLPLLPAYERKLISYSAQQYMPLQDVQWEWNKLGAAFYNMGLMVLDQRIRRHLNGQTPRQFIERPEFERFVNGEGGWRWSTDQTLMNYWVRKTGMTRQNLSWRWNVLWSYVRQDVLARTPPYFVHFNLASKFPRAGAEIPDIIERMVQCAPSA